LWQGSGLENRRRGAHIRRMGRNIAIIAGAALIALAILVTNHWEIHTGSNGMAATIRLNRWTGDIDVCALDTTVKTAGATAAGLQLRCISE
jgi:hypothetical protein